LNKQTEYEIGEKLTCRNRFIMKGCVFNVNYKYEIIDNSSDKSIKIKDISSLEEFDIPRSLIQSNFIYKSLDYKHCHQQLRFS
jgi:hypothetical protein